MSLHSDRQIVGIVKRMGLVRPVDLEAKGISRARLYELTRKGLIERRARGVYVVTDHSYTEAHTLAQVAKRVPSGVFCLLTALQFHQLTTQLPHEVWIAIGEKARRPHLEHVRLRVTRFSGQALTEGIELHRIEGVDVRVYSAAKTVVDCFKYRNKIGLDVAMEAIRDAWRARRVTMDEIARFARQCRVDRVMRPYLEMLVA